MSAQQPDQPRPTADALLHYLGEHDEANLHDTLTACGGILNLESALKTIATLTTAGYVSYDVRVSLRLTPLGRELIRQLPDD